MIIKDLSDELAAIEVALEALDYSWEHPRIRAFMAEVGKRSGINKVDKHRLPDQAIAVLAEKLREEVEARGNGSRNRPDSR
jgi:hypothetical protein